MPRRGRAQSSTGIYHVMLRGINRQDIFMISGDGSCDNSKSNAYIHSGRNGERFFNAGKYRVGIHNSTKGGGRTIHINYNNGEKIYKIRTEK